jgi:hypothetical protein
MTQFNLYAGLMHRWSLNEIMLKSELFILHGIMCCGLMLLLLFVCVCVCVFACGVGGAYC